MSLGRKPGFSWHALYIAHGIGGVGGGGGGGVMCVFTLCQLDPSAPGRQMGISPR